MKKYLKNSALYVIIFCILINSLNFAVFTDSKNEKIGVSSKDNEATNLHYRDTMPIVRRQVFPEDKSRMLRRYVRPLSSKEGIKGSVKDHKQPLQKKLPTSIKINNIVIFLRFKDEDEFINTENRQLFIDHYNNDNLSLKSYVNDLSYDQCKVVSEFFPVDSEGKFCSYKAEHERDYYRPIEKSKIGYISREMSDQREHQLLSEVVSRCRPMIEKKYPDESDLDFNGNGKIDNIVFIVSGKEDTWNDLLWPHQFAIEKSYDTKIHSKRVKLYNFMLQSCFRPNNIGTSAHEFLHTMGFPDFYRYKSKGEPVGKWDLMSIQYEIPQFPLVYTRYKFGNFCNKPTLITEGGKYTIYPSTSKDYKKDIAYIIKSPIRDDIPEYFVVEYRSSGNGVDRLQLPKLEESIENSQSIDDQYCWDKSLPGEGILVYRVNKKVERGNSVSDGLTRPDNIFVFRKGITEPKLADGDIENGALLKTGDCLGVVDDIKKDLKKKCIPHKLEDLIYFSDGSNSGIRLYNINIDENLKVASFDVELTDTFITNAKLKEAKTTIVDKENKIILFNLNKNFNSKFIVPEVECTGVSIDPAKGHPLIISDDMKYIVVSPVGMKQTWKVITSPISEERQYKKVIKPQRGDTVVINANIINKKNVNYQWYCDGNIIDGEVSEQIEVFNPLDNKKHKYFVVACNEAGKLECAHTTVEWEKSRLERSRWPSVPNLLLGLLSPKKQYSDVKKTDENLESAPSTFRRNTGDYKTTQMKLKRLSANFESFKDEVNEMNSLLDNDGLKQSINRFSEFICDFDELLDDFEGQGHPTTRAVTPPEDEKMKLEEDVRSEDLIIENNDEISQEKNLSKSIIFGMSDRDISLNETTSDEDLTFTAIIAEDETKQDLVSENLSKEDNELIEMFPEDMLDNTSDKSDKMDKVDESKDMDLPLSETKGELTSEEISEEDDELEKMLLLEDVKDEKENESKVFEDDDRES